AALAGVSKATASRTLSRPEVVSPETAARVLTAALSSSTAPRKDPPCPAPPPGARSPSPRGPSSAPSPWPAAPAPAPPTSPTRRRSWSAPSPSAWRSSRRP
ncbi:LacI family DNA-binding transcriptional regulator, partial [Rathayibacter sp. AY1A3]|uniref:LacI family DNA-binding transcriptional regulator n=1 Tax=Rathayibacter sp. AY1A3 TaxID=2080521 RepID=UPI000D44ADE7